jgi:hypothetical protein
MVMPGELDRYAQHLAAHAARRIREAEELREGSRLDLSRERREVWDRSLYSEPTRNAAATAAPRAFENES